MQPMYLAGQTRDASGEGFNAGRFPLGWLIILVLAGLAGCHSPFYADRGAAVGALSGALAGAALGEHQGDAAAGAAVGAAVGTLAGAAVGDAIDQDIARSRAIIEQRLGRQVPGAVSVPDVIAMSRAGLSDPVVAAHIHANGVSRPARVDDLITMRNEGVSDVVIQAMQQAHPASAHPPGYPVIVEEHHFVAPPPAPWHPPVRRHHGRHRGHHDGRFHWGFSLGN